MASSTATRKGRHPATSKQETANATNPNAGKQRAPRTTTAPKPGTAASKADAEQAAAKVTEQVKAEAPKAPTKADRRKAGQEAIAANIKMFAEDPPADGLLPLTYVLVNGDFEVHRPDCKSVITSFMKSDYQEPAVMAAASARDTVLELWDDQIRESDNIADSDNPTEDELSAYYGATIFHGCVHFPGDEDGKSAKREAKHRLARAMIEAMGEAFEKLDAETKAALGGDLAAGAIASAWVHHLPTGEIEGKRVWPTAELPRPDRSDWR